MAELGRVMALDVGDARVGVALTDALRITAQPHSTVERSDGALSRIAALVAEFGVTELVIGLPKDLRGEVGEQAQKVLKFKAELEACLAAQGSSPSIALLDERFTTEEAKRVVVGSKLKNRDQRAALDRVSAALILRTYLERGPSLS